MIILLDTNILLRLVDTSSPQHSIALNVVKQLESENHSLVIVPQIVYEYWVVATRPKDKNGLGMPPDVAALAIEYWIENLRLFRDERGIFSFWQDLVKRYFVCGKNAHDARLVAAMHRHKIPALLTFNVVDFKRFSGIQVVSPNDVLSDKNPFAK